MTDRPERKKKKKKERKTLLDPLVEGILSSRWAGARVEEGNNRVDSRDLVDGVVFRGCCSSGY